jgi:uncharacterized protein Veg
MNSRILLPVLFSLCLSICFGQTRPPNRIDSIKNIKQLKAFLKPFGKRYNDDFKINERVNFNDKDCQRLADSLNIPPFLKADIDNNGLTDLVILGSWGTHHVLCIFDSSNNHFVFKPLTIKIFDLCSFPVIETNGGKTFINLIGFEETGWRFEDDVTKVLIKNLVYKFGDFIEYNDSVNDYHIQKIEYKTTMCFGTCPVFSLTIDSNRTANYNALQFNKLKGHFNAIIKEKDYTDLIDVLNYSRFPYLNNDYKVSWTDDQSSTLTITYNNGKKKTIQDYGLIGTYGLRKAYESLFNLRENQQWQKVQN